MSLAVDADEHLIKVPAPVRPVAPVYPPFPDLASKHRTEPVPPIAHRLVADVDTTFEQDVFDLAQRQRIADVHHHRETDDLGRAVKITKGIVHYHRLREVPFQLNPTFSDNARLIHHSDRGVQYLSIRYTERLSEAGITPSVGSVGDSYDNALAETVIGLFKTEVIRHQGPWKNIEEVEFATLTWVDWFNNSRLLEPSGDRPPAEKENEYYQQPGESARAGLTQTKEAPVNPGRFILDYRD